MLGTVRQPRAITALLAAVAFTIAALLPLAQPVSGAPYTISTWRKVAMGPDMGCAIANYDGGALFCWGDLPTGRVGAPVYIVGTTPYGIPSSVTDVWVGDTNYCAIVAGDLWCAGVNASGQVGDGTKTNRNTPVPVVGLPDGVVSGVALGANSTCAIVAGTVYCAGDGRVDWTAVGGLIAGVEIDQITYASGAYCVRGDTRIWCWGTGSTGLLGNGSTSVTSTTAPILATLITTRPVASLGVVDPTSDRICAITVADTLFCWGSGITTGTVIAGTPTGLLSAAIGSRHGCVTYPNGNKCFGADGHGQLGRGVLGDWAGWQSWTSVAVSTPSLAVAAAPIVAAGRMVTCWLTATQTLHCSGAGSWGRRGVGAWAARLRVYGQYWRCDSSDGTELYTTSDSAPYDPECLLSNWPPNGNNYRWVPVTNTGGSSALPEQLIVTLNEGPTAPSVITSVTLNTSGPAVGTQVNLTGINWAGWPWPTMSHQWYQCENADVAGTPIDPACTAISGATLSSYSPVASDAGKLLRLKVTGTNASGSAESTSATTSAVTRPAGRNVAPAIASLAIVGESVTVDTGSWVGYPAPTVVVTWRRCTHATDSRRCATIPGVSGTSYTLASADSGKWIRALVTANNATGSASYLTSSTSQITMTPMASVVPSIAGSPRVGQRLTGRTGTWLGYPTPTLTYAWERCPTNLSESGGDADCATISGAASRTYVLTQDDAGYFIRFAVTGTTGDTAVTAKSDTTGLVSARPLPANPLPAIQGDPLVGEPINVSNGTWTASPDAAITFDWRRCTSTTDATLCTSISGATVPEYTPVDADAGKYLRVVVTARNDYGSYAVTTVAKYVRALPTVTVSPVVSGGSRVGGVLSVTSGTWFAYPAPTYAYGWYRCATDGGAMETAPPECEVISGETSASYTVTQSDLLYYVRATVRATNVAGSSNATSATSPLIGFAPVNTSAPVVSGSPVVGVATVASVGTWDGNPTPDLSYQWQKCPSSVDMARCAAISGANSASYTPVIADAGAFLRIKVTATNMSGSAVAYSSVSSSYPVASRPAVGTAPTLTGGITQGTTLTATKGTWTGVPAPVLSVQWYRCTEALAGAASAVPNDCTVIDGQTSLTYVSREADLGLGIRVVIAATNGSGTVYAATAATARIASLPRVSVAPGIIGEPAVGELLAVRGATWIAVPAADSTYQWLRCTSTAESSCTDIPLATGETYVPTLSDAARWIRVRETATNAAGSAVSVSPSTEQITVPASNTVAPSLLGTPTRGTLLIGNAGTWIGTPVPTLTYAWYRCDAQVTAAVEPQDGCIAISGATALSYRLTDSDLEKYIVFGATGTNAGRSLLMLTASTSMVTVPTLNAAPPTVAGTYSVGSSLTGSTGTWQGTPSPVLAYQWMRCSAAADILRCVEIFEATDLSYTVSGDDAGSWIRLRVTGSNAGATVVAYSVAPTAAVSGPPAVITEATVGCDSAAYCAKTVGGGLTAYRGTWAGLPAPTVAHTWYVCDYPHGFDELGDDCALVPSSSTVTKYTALRADKYYRIKVVATNSQGTATAWSATSVAIAAAPNLATGSAVSIGLDGAYLEVGSMLTAITGDWTGSPEPDFSYAWAICTSAAGTSCTNAAGATDPEFEVPDEASGKWIRLSVTASNVAGSALRSAMSITGVYAAPDLAEATVSIVNSSVPSAPVGGIALGNTLTATISGATGFPVPTYTYRWQQCDLYYDEDLGEEVPSCEDIPGATARTYTVGSADLGSAIRVQVTGKNDAGEATAESDLTKDAIGVPQDHVSSLTATSAAAKTLRITWLYTTIEQPNYPVTGFKIVLSGKNTKTVFVGITARTWTFTGLTAGSTTVKVYAINWAGTDSVPATRAVTVK